jgi:hypothetical protein
MGVTLQFAIGNRDAIIDAIKNLDLDFLNKLESNNQLADFSLHLEPVDLNYLVNSAAELKAKPSLGLRENLDTETFYYDSEEGGAFLVAPIITDLFSEFDKSESTELTNKWFEKMRAVYNDDTEVTDDAISSVEKLISICKEAKSLNNDLVHIWSL